MLVLYVGGSMNRKSGAVEGAATTAAKEAKRPLIYLTTVGHGGKEAAAWIEKHQTRRAEEGSVTVEKAHAMHKLTLPAGAVALLEDLGSLVGNEFFSPEAGERNEETVLCVLDESLLVLGKKYRQLTPVGALLAEEPRYEGPDTGRYVRILSALQSALTARADAVYLVELGAVCYLRRKGGP